MVGASSSASPSTPTKSPDGVDPPTVSGDNADPNSPGHRPAHANNHPRPSMTRHLLPALAGILALATPGFAQTSAGPREAESDEPIIELSPFSVDASEDEGYAATTTLAGSRIKSNLRDLGASISVTTQEFMQDTGATDGESLLSFVGNVEVGGVLGNFSNVDTDNFSTNESRNNPQRGQRVRGLVSATTTRDYFQTDIPFDSYNTSRVEVNRGPNSILFGLGSPGGVINNSTNLARIGQNFGAVEFRIDHNGGNRRTFDYNRTLVEDRLALRLGLLGENIEFQQEPAFENDDRLYVAFDWTVFKNERSTWLGKTTLRGSLEDGRIVRNPPDVVPPTDGFSSWFVGVGGQEALNAILRVPGASLSNINNGAVQREWVLGAIAAGLVTVPAGMTADQFASIEGQFTPGGLVDRIRRTGRTTIQQATPYFLFPAINFNSPNAGTAPGWRSSELAGIQGIMARWRPRTNGVNLTQDMSWTNPATGGPGFQPSSLNNREIFDYHDFLFQGTTNRVTTDFDIKQLYLEQALLGGRAGFELAWNRQNRTQERFNAFSSGVSKTIGIDVDLWHAPADGNNDGIPDRTPNENVGRPVVQWNDNATVKEWGEQETLRATVFGTLDTRDFLDGWVGKVLGSHTVTGLYEDRQSDSRSRTTQGVWWADSGKFPGSVDISNGDNDNFRRVVKSQVYLGPDVRGQTSPGAVRLDGPISVPFPRVGETYGIWYFDNNNAIRSGVQNNWRIIEALQGANVSRNTLESKAISLQGRLFWDNIVALYAWREDEQKVWRRLQETAPRGPTGSTALRLDDPGFNQTDGNFNEGLLFLEDTPFGVDKDSTTTWSIVAKYPENWLGELPWGMKLSAHYYEAESFQPASGQVNILNQPLVSPLGSTKEFGGTIELLRNRLSIRINRFETVNANARTNLGNQLTGNNGGIVGQVGFFLTRIAEAENSGLSLFPSDADRLLTTTTNPSNRQRTTGTDADLIGVNSYDEYYQRLINILPPEVQAIYNYRAIRNASGRVDIFSDPLDGVLQETLDFVAKGWEVDVVGRLTDNWSVSLNIAQQQTVTSNTGPVAIPLAFEIDQRIRDQGLFLIRDSPFQGEQGTIGAGRYASIIRTLQVEKAKDNTATQEQREWRINLVSRYDFREGALKGWSIGGGLRYQDAIAAGYPNIFDEFGNAVPDISNPQLGPDEINGDLFIRYQRKLRDKIDWSIQFNARNLYRKNGNDDIPVSINPDGAVAIIRIPNEQQFFVTNTFRF